VASWIGDAPPSSLDARPWGLNAPLGPIPDGSPAAPRIVTVPDDCDPDAVATAVRSWDEVERGIAQQTGAE
jgi:hypothetical protein